MKQILVVGGILTGLAIIYNAIQKRRADVPIYVHKKLAGDYNARTIPPFGIFITEKEKNNLSLINHELVHWKQYQDRGLIKFYLDYSCELSRYGYDAMPMEMEARENESEYCRNNYTECVRNGTAKTVYNPMFRSNSMF